MKEIKRKLASGFLAVAMAVGQVPMLRQEVEATSLTKEEAYLNVLEGVVQSYGISSKEFYEYSSGLAHAEVIDFNKDGVDELLLLYLDGNNFSFILELWEYRDGLAVQLATDNIGSVLRDGGYLHLETRENGTLQLHFMSTATSGGYAHYIDKYWTYSNGTFEAYDMDFYAEFYSEPHTTECVINEEEVSVETFDSIKNTLDMVVDEEMVAGYYSNFPFFDEQTIHLYYELLCQKLDLEEVAKRLPYTGYLEKMNLSSEQALAMAEEIEDFYSSNSYGMWVALFDSGTGVPGMWVLNSHDPGTSEWDFHGKKYDTYLDDYSYYFSSNHDNLWYFWNDTTNRLYTLDKPAYNWVYSLYLNDEGLAYPGGDMSCGGQSTVMCYFDLTGGVNNGISIYSLFLQEDFPNVTNNSVLEQRIVSTAKDYLANYGISGDIKVNLDDFFITFYDADTIGSFGTEGAAVDGCISDGVSVDVSSDTRYSSFRENIDFELNVHAFDTNYTSGNWADGKEVASLLRIYGEKAQNRYNFPEVSQTTDVTYLFGDLGLSGNMVECYEIASQFYYVIMEENGVETAYLIRCVKKNGEVIYEILSQSTDFLTEDQLYEYGNAYLFDSNISLEETQLVNNTTVADFISFYTTALENITGASLNDSGKSQLAQSMQDSISQFSTTFLTVTETVAEINGEQVVSLVANAEELFSGLMSLLESESETLNKDLEQSVQVILRGLDESNWTIYLSPDLKGLLQGNNLQIFLESGKQGLELSSEDLDILLEETGGLFINVQQTDTDQYRISFADSDGNTLEKLSAPVKFYLPTTNSLATVMLDYAQGTENWGGQFHSLTNTIQFSTIHTGTYRIVDNSVAVNDVSPEYLSVIQFMVSKGFFDVDDQGNFNPYGTMTRNDFTKTIVSMFFALDRDLQTTFLDVFEDSPYYAYIASGESREIVAGFDDGYFYGESVMSEEMAFSLIAQTLVDKKSYVYPEDMDFYLNTRTVLGDYSEWSPRGIALCFRDNIVLPTESVSPLADLTRENAAIYLYRLFTLLEERQQVNFSLSEDILEELVDVSTEEEEKSAGTLYVAMTLGVASIAAGAYLRFGQKKKES